MTDAHYAAVSGHLRVDWKPARETGRSQQAANARQATVLDRSYANSCLRPRITKGVHLNKICDKLLDHVLFGTAWAMVRIASQSSASHGGSTGRLQTRPFYRKAADPALGADERLAARTELGARRGGPSRPAPKLRPIA